MPFHPNRLVQSLKQVELLSLTLQRNQRYVVWWYGAVSRNMKDNWVPRIVVWFREISNGGSFGDFRASTVALTSLGQLRIGSVWENSRSREQYLLETRQVQVDFTTGHWTHARSNAEHRASTGEELVAQGVYPLPYQASDRSKLLSLDHSDGTLLIPCLEYLRCYGRSQELNRVITTFEWDEIVHRLRLDAPVDPLPGWSVIDLPAWASEHDAHLLAHLRYSPFTRKHVRRVRSDIQNQFASPTSGVAYAFPTIGPWFEGPAQLEVEGVAIAKSTFLALRITGYTVPSKPGIRYLRAEFPEVGDEDYSGNPHPPTRTRNLKQDEVTPVADGMAPDHGSETVVIADPSIRLLGEAAPIINLTSINSAPRGSPGPSPKKSEASAPGDAKGTGKGVGRAQFNSQIDLESQGALRDLWNGLVHLQAQHPTLLTVLGWVTLEGAGESSHTSEPKLVSLDFPEDMVGESPLSAPARKWVYMYPDQPEKPRGVLLIEVGSPLTKGYLFEVQRKVVSSKDSDDNDGLREQNYCGLAVTPSNGKELSDWIPKVLYQIAECKGIMSKVLASEPSIDGQDYRRSSSNSDEVAGQSTAANALRKLGITVPRKSPSRIPLNT